MRLALAAMVELNQQLGWRPREKKRMENVLVYIDLVKSKRQRIQTSERTACITRRDTNVLAPSEVVAIPGN
ncbi:hypothetical protein KIN20_003446 [Parelaphostrongylus tenuis]|uniref:Uncharacterized protein n=1 Tax=Parelaphostrongylus tenuis TaxID=148309 RepID=A0AAD5M1G5_PARTN|nr:hypothetical protein KIN20_003446 [Parelaphostrongylus tenuis]